MSFIPKLKCNMHVYITAHIWSSATVAVKLVLVHTYSYIIPAQKVYYLSFMYFVAFTHPDLFFCQKYTKQNLKIHCRSVEFFPLHMQDREEGKKEKKKKTTTNPKLSPWLHHCSKWKLKRLLKMLNKISAEEATNHRNRWSTGLSTELQFVWAHAVELGEACWVSESNSLLS